MRCFFSATLKISLGIPINPPTNHELSGAMLVFWKVFLGSTHEMLLFRKLKWNPKLTPLKRKHHLNQSSWFTLPKTNSSHLKRMVGRRSFPFGAQHLIRCELLVSGRVSNKKTWELQKKTPKKIKISSEVRDHFIKENPRFRWRGLPLNWGACFGLEEIGDLNKNPSVFGFQVCTTNGVKLMVSLGGFLDFVFFFNGW